MLFFFYYIVLLPTFYIVYIGYRFALLLVSEA